MRLIILLDTLMSKSLRSTPLNSHLLLIFFLCPLCVIFVQSTSVATAFTSNGWPKHSDVAVMNSIYELSQLEKYKIDIISWGNQIGQKPKNIVKQKALFNSYKKSNLSFFSVSIALIQEGGKFVICGGESIPACSKLFWELRKENEKTLQKIKELGISIKDRAVLDINGNVIGVPWLSQLGLIPMACVNKPDLSVWLQNKVRAMTQTKPVLLHFDEPLMGVRGITVKGNPGCFCADCQVAFNKHLQTRPESLWKRHGIQTLSGFSYRDFIKSRRVHPIQAPLWSEYETFQLNSAVRIVKDLRDLAKSLSESPLKISANAAPHNWLKLPLIPHLDYISAEVDHEAKSLNVPDSPLLAYKMGDAFRKPVFSTAFGTDWKLMKQDDHPLLVSSWIAQAYALGHQMMIPVKAWVPGSSYLPSTGHYASLTHWIKEIKNLLDDFETVSTSALVINLNSLKVPSDKQRIVELCVLLVKNGVPFNIIFEGNDLAPQSISLEDLETYESVIVGLPEYLSSEAKTVLDNLASKIPVWIPDMQKTLTGLPESIVSPITIAGADSIFCLPRMKIADGTPSFVLHLLNRDYNSNNKKMKSKGPFTLRIKRGFLANPVFSGVKLHQPSLEAVFPNLQNSQLDISEEISFDQSSDDIIITISHLELWGIVEFTN